MNLLALDTSNWALAVGVLADGQVIGELNTNIPKNHSLRLMPGVEALLQQVDLSPVDLHGIAVSHGPGSYTGVRIGVTTAKTMAWSLGVPLLGISSLQVVAQNRAAFPGRIIPMFDARRGQVYTGVYAYDEDAGIVQRVTDDRLLLVEDLLQDLQKEQEPFLFFGEGSKKHAQQISEWGGGAGSARVRLAAPHEHPPRGAQLAYLAGQLWHLSTDQVHLVAPQYLQLAEAEQKWLEQQTR
jgi:tRNA threonylcarbamoyladenosine biosynthesis protein TsaB